ncbi:MAG TPA: hypothetical protein DEQ40_09045, partial [Oxalobacteraceae bacterium]|nr:hypothetical protein [Oxalobacteraceae bacterium]
MYSVHAIWNSGPLNGVEFCGLARLPADRGDAELEANAQLIARAPDLRAFAELVARMLLDGETDDGHAYDPTAIDDRDTLESLIVKARELTGIEGPG